jgi:hypothetical protein
MILKQAEILHGKISNQQRVNWRNIIFRDLVNAFKDMLSAMDQKNMKFIHDKSKVGGILTPKIKLLTKQGLGKPYTITCSRRGQRVAEWAPTRISIAMAR